MSTATTNLDLSIFPPGLRERVAAHQQQFAGFRMDGSEAEAPPADEAEVKTEVEPKADEKLGTAGQKALEAERSKAAEATRLNAQLTEKVTDLESKLTTMIEALTGKTPEAEVTPEDAISQLTELKSSIEKRDQELAERTRRNAVRAQATAAGFIDPADALQNIDLSKLEINADGDVDSSAVETLVNELVTAKPYLVQNKPGSPAAQHLGVGTKGGISTPLSGRDLIAAEMAKVARAAG